MIIQTMYTPLLIAVNIMEIVLVQIRQQIQGRKMLQREIYSYTITQAQLTCIPVTLTYLRQLCWQLQN